MAVTAYIQIAAAVENEGNRPDGETTREDDPCPDGMSDRRVETRVDHSEDRSKNAESHDEPGATVRFRVRKKRLRDEPVPEGDNGGDLWLEFRGR